MKIGIKDVLHRIRPFFILYLLVLTACLVVKLLYSRSDIYFAVNGLNAPWADAIAPYITNMGDGRFVVALSVITALFNYRKAFLMITSFCTSSVVAQLLKHFFDAPRPIVYFAKQLSRIHLVDGVYIAVKHSFPSGHTVTAFSAAVVITYLCKNKSWGVAALLMAIVIGYSRMYLSQHFFEDVMAGSVIGVMITVFWLSWLDSFKFIHTEGWNRGLFFKA